MSITDPSAMPGCTLIVLFRDDVPVGLLQHTLDVERRCCTFVTSTYDSSERRLTFTVETFDQDPRLDSLLHALA